MQKNFQKQFSLMLMDTLTKGKFSKQSKNSISSFTKDILSAQFRKSFSSGQLFVLKLDIISQCNIACKFCYRQEKPSQLSLDDIKSTIKDLNYADIQLLGGEPMLHKDLNQIIKTIKKNRTLTCSMYSNGTLIDKSKAASLKQSGLDYIVINLISSDKDLHDELTTIAGSWQKTIKGIKNLLNNNIKVFTYTAINKKNCSEIKSIAKLSTQLGAKQIFHRYIPLGKEDPLAITDLDKWYDIKRWILKQNNPTHGNYIKQMLKLHKRSCMGGNIMLSVKSDGNVTPCPFIHDINIGNIHKSSIIDIFRRRFQNKDFMRFYNPSKECSSCILEKECNSGCRAIDVNKKDDLCKGPWKKKKDSDNDICEMIPYWW